ncbi:MAG: HEPN domain-containing protein [bacterium]
MTYHREASDFWKRALETLIDAERAYSTNGMASRAYYCAFYAVCALLALEGVEFKKHQAVEQAVHRDLVHTKRWPEELGAEYSDLFKFRLKGDYGGSVWVTTDEARQAVEYARHILQAVHEAQPDIFPLAARF